MMGEGGGEPKPRSAGRELADVEARGGVPKGVDGAVT